MAWTLLLGLFVLHWCQVR